MSRWSSACRRSLNHSGLHLAQGFWSDDGERVTIVEFEHEEGQAAWRMHPEHLEAQKLGRTKYYEMYDIKVAQVTYHRHHERKIEAQTGA
jgi:heme-degrading monooxygenase HmoA